MSATVGIRAASPADIPTIGRLGALLVQVHHEFDAERFIAATPQTEQGYGAYLGTQFNKANVIVLVAELHGEVIGYTWAGLEGYDYMSLRGPAGVVYDIVVATAYRGHGVGHLLLDAALTALSARGAPRVVLSTAAKNVAAQRLFERAGFRQTMIEMTRESDAPS